MNLINEAAQWVVLAGVLLIAWNFAKHNPAKVQAELEKAKQLAEGYKQQAQSAADRAEQAVRDAADKVRQGIADYKANK